MTTETPCPKAPHTGTGYLHAENYDGPYDVDGVEYCGRCHYVLGLCRASNAPKPAEPPACIICGNILTDGGEPYCWDHQPQPQGSEPPIDYRFEAMHAAWKAEQAISAALKARVEKYEDLIEAGLCNNGACITTQHNIAVCAEARAIRARKEQEAAK